MDEKIVDLLLEQHTQHREDLRDLRKDMITGFKEIKDDIKPVIADRNKARGAIWLGSGLVVILTEVFIKIVFG